MVIKLPQKPKYGAGPKPVTETEAEEAEESVKRRIANTPNSKTIPIAVVYNKLNSCVDYILHNAEKSKYGYSNGRVIVIDNDPQFHKYSIEVSMLYYHKGDVDFEHNTITMPLVAKEYEKVVKVGHIMNKDLWKYPVSLDGFTNKLVSDAVSISNRYNCSPCLEFHNYTINITNVPLPHTINLSDYKFYYNYRNSNYAEPFLLISKCEIGWCYNNLWVYSHREETCEKVVYGEKDNSESVGTTITSVTSVTTTATSGNSTSTTEVKPETTAANSNNTSATDNKPESTDTIGNNTSATDNKPESTATTVIGDTTHVIKPMSIDDFIKYISRKISVFTIDDIGAIVTYADEYVSNNPDFDCDNCMHIYTMRKYAAEKMNIHPVKLVKLLNEYIQNVVSPSKQ